MKYSLTLGAALVMNWLCWSGHFESPFLLTLGLLSCLVCLWISSRMKIIDEEGAPIQLGIRPFTRYAPWLIKEIVRSNFEVAGIILSRQMKLQRNMVTVPTRQKTELGRVILANSITLTPGTVAVQVVGSKIRVHALSLEDAAEDLSGEMDARIEQLECGG
ncbi:Na+/H+ antiporter subunit E [Stieleria tagensis]|uniref:Na+/H+ antiporter subunit E n=1 Tax=Stieleria tagensis TaxID=2956795 RepID=UPI00209B46B8|nr:Na+/H+ antiporter subunit E [Stieleria tagensis]